ncbi:unnamed protein product [Trypanosoma congolense IL3000]|uniref:WGS project CAEQ00000000 data, annotated contig 1774 n=1 Tax=Trypanosoma congolense (strain IL3000) TaxID=1068625 RepID=F9WK48_TRYCI|nr:unnamed protein product [Trypanosoma congolense IL3000]CCD17709.1 unnamed protein product [Trypanosoma congolense IL3000]
MRSVCNKWAALALSHRAHGRPSLLSSLPHYTTGGSICCRDVQPKSAGITHLSLLPTLHTPFSAASSVQLLTGISQEAVAWPCGSSFKQIAFRVVKVRRLLPTVVQHGSPPGTHAKQLHSLRKSKSSEVQAALRQYGPFDIAVPASSVSCDHIT